MPLPAITAEPRRRQGEQRPEPLAAGRHDMRGKLRDERDRALHPLDDETVAGFEIGLDKRDQRVQRAFGAGSSRLDLRGFGHSTRFRIHFA
jgi:hypothetical protein